MACCVYTCLGIRCIQLTCGCLLACVAQIADTVLALHAKGVVVRVITDDGMAKGQGSDIQKFIDAVRANAIEAGVAMLCGGV